MAYKSVYEQIRAHMDEVQKDIEDLVNDTGLQVAKECVAELKHTSPVGKNTRHSGRYARSWTYREDKGLMGAKSYVVYNSRDWQLTHLLENGHLIRNAYGIQTRRDGGGTETSPIKHISTAEEKFCQEYYVRISRGIK